MWHNRRAQDILLIIVQTSQLTGLDAEAVAKHALMSAINNRIQVASFEVKASQAPVDILSERTTSPRKDKSSLILEPLICT